jgi:hypothetical protein
MTSNLKLWLSVIVGYAFWQSMVMAQSLPILSQQFSGVYSPYAFIGDTLYFLRYDKGGNDKNLCSIDVQGTLKAPLLKSEKNVLLIAQNDRWSVYAGISQESTFVQPLILKKKESQEEITRIKLSDRILWAGIRSNKLLLLQQTDRGFGFDAVGLVLALPSLKVIKKSDLIRTGSAYRPRFVAEWKDKLLIAGHAIGLYDTDFNLTAEISAPPPTRGSVRWSRSLGQPPGRNKLKPEPERWF